MTSFILALKEGLVVRLVILGISPLTSFILALREAVVAKLLFYQVFYLQFLILALYTSFLMTLFFTTSLSLLKSTGTGTNLSTSNLSTFVFQIA